MAIIFAYCDPVSKDIFMGFGGAYGVDGTLFYPHYQTNIGIRKIHGFYVGVVSGQYSHPKDIIFDILETIDIDFPIKPITLHFDLLVKGKEKLEERKMFEDDKKLSDYLSKYSLIFAQQHQAYCFGGGYLPITAFSCFGDGAGLMESIFNLEIEKNLPPMDVICRALFYVSGNINMVKPPFFVTNVTQGISYRINADGSTEKFAVMGE